MHKQCKQWRVHSCVQNGILHTHFTCQFKTGRLPHTPVIVTMHACRQRTRSEQATATDGSSAQIIANDWQSVVITLGFDGPRIKNIKSP